MLTNLIILFLSLMLLVVSSDFFISGAISVSQKSKLPDVFIGGVIVAIGTSAPELVINIIASVKGEHNVVISNLVGSNIVNICLGIGASLFIVKLSFDKYSTVFIYLLGLAGAFVFYLGFLYSDDAKFFILPSYLGYLLVCLFVIYLIAMSKIEAEDEEADNDDKSLLRGLLYLVVGGIALLFFAELVVESAVSLAKLVNIPDQVIGATIVAAGGSLPEVAACLAAAKKQKTSIIIGTIGGSQIFNIFGILGVSLMIGDVRFASSLGVDVLFLIIATVFVLALNYLRPSGLYKKSGVVLVLIYLAYMFYLYSIL